MDTSDQQLIAVFLEDSVRALHAFVQGEAGHKAIIEFADAITDAIGAGRKLMIAGNGGSAADAQHIAAEFVSRLFFDHAPLPAIALTTDTSVLTAVGNDYGFDKIFERQILGIGVADDVFLGISTSGKSPNVLRALDAARSKGIVTLGFTGRSPGAMAEVCDLLLCAPSDQTAIIQQIHLVAAHLICGLAENRIFGPKALAQTAK
jgi:D-sedoheptulose 7-phosphate isomerase